MTAQTELLQTQKGDVESLARRWQGDNEALQTRLDAASQRLERLSVERDEAVRQRDVEMRQLQGEGSQLGEMMRLAMQGAQREAATTAERLQMTEGRCSKLLLLLEAAHAANTAGAAQLAVARAELHGLEVRGVALHERAARAEAWGAGMARERDEARDEAKRLGHLGVVQEHVHEFAAEAMNARFTELSEAFEGQWPVEWCDALVSGNVE